VAVTIAAPAATASVTRAVSAVPASFARQAVGVETAITVSPAISGTYTVFVPTGSGPGNTWRLATTQTGTNAATASVTFTSGKGTVYVSTPNGKHAVSLTVSISQTSQPFTTIQTTQEAIRVDGVA